VSDATQTIEMVFKGKHGHALLDDTTRELDIEGAIRAGKTTVCLHRELRAALAYPGIAILFARWTDSGVYGLVLPLWRRICDAAGVKLIWHADEEFDLLPNGSQVYVRGLKTQDAVQRYSKLRGLTLSRVYIDQAEEIPQDIYLELAGRLSQKGYPHQITISPQSVDDGHWIAREFPADNSKLPHRKLISLSVHDNAHNLEPSVVPALERLYPPSHPKHKTLILGLRGMNVTGEPVYKGAFIRGIHEAEAEYDPRLTLEMALDFGKHHPCVIFRQVSVVGQVRYLGGILGQQLYLDDFCDIVLRYRQNWFPNATIKECCDPAGTVDTSHGTHGAYKTLSEKGIHPISIPDSNSPGTRLAAVERMAAQMRKRAADRQEAFVVSSSERWLRISEQSTVMDRFLADGFEAGYVWDEHLVSVNNKQVRKPKKDGWYEHGQNCAEYLELNFGMAAPKEKKVPQGSGYRLPSGDAGWMGA
jgi:hypothetical protein